MATASIRIGNQTSKEVPYHEPFEFALLHGFDAFEWFSDRGRGGWSEDEMDADARKLLKKRCKDNGLLCSVHAPYEANPTTAEGQAAILRSIAFAGDVSGKVVNIHLFPDHPARVYAESLVPLLEACKKAKVHLSLENTPAVGPDHINAVFGVLSAVSEAKKRVGLCFDMGHANLHEGTKNNYCRYLDLLGEHVPIIQWHAHENWGDSDSHLTLFTGPAGKNDGGLRELLSRLVQRGFDGSVVLEQWPNPSSLLVQARDRLREMIDAV